jgi:hypothetical protein
VCIAFGSDDMGHTINFQEYDFVAVVSSYVAPRSDWSVKRAIFLASQTSNLILGRRGIYIYGESKL